MPIFAVISQQARFDIACDLAPCGRAGIERKSFHFQNRRWFKNVQDESAPIVLRSSNMIGTISGTRDFPPEIFVTENWA